MIRLKKQPKPQILHEKGHEWTTNLLNKLANNEEPSKYEKSRYSHAEIKSTLYRETHEKCAYCESKLTHITYGDIEHVVPKNTDPARWFDWDNLTLACDICNTKKGVNDKIVDPYDADPERRFIFHGSTIVAHPGDEEAALTTITLDLNRDRILGKRRERMEYLISLIEVIYRTKSNELKGVLISDFLSKEIDDSVEYAAMSRSIARLYSEVGVL